MLFEVRFYLFIYFVFLQYVMLFMKHSLLGNAVSTEPTLQAIF